MAREPIRVLIAENDPALSDRLARLLSQQAGLLVIGDAGTVVEAVTRTVDLCPDVLLLDFDLPDGTGADASAVVRYVRPETKVVFLARDATHPSGPRAGVAPTIRTSQGGREIAAVIRAVAET